MLPEQESGSLHFHDWARPGVAWLSQRETETGALTQYRDRIKLGISLGELEDKM